MSYICRLREAKIGFANDSNEFLLILRKQASGQDVNIFIDKELHYIFDELHLTFSMMYHSYCFVLIWNCIFDIDFLSDVDFWHKWWGSSSSSLQKWAQCSSTLHKVMMVDSGICSCSPFGCCVKPWPYCIMSIINTIEESPLPCLLSWRIHTLINLSIQNIWYKSLVCGVYFF